MGIGICDAETVLLGAHFLRVRCLATPLMFASFFTVYVFQGLDKGQKALFLGVMRWADIPMLFLLNAVIGMYGLVWPQLCADILTVTLSYIVFSRYARRLQQTETA